MHRRGAIGLPATLVGQVPVCVCAGDLVMKAAPEIFVKCVDIAAPRIGPTLHAFRTDGVFRPAIEIFRIGFVIWISG